MFSILTSKLKILNIMGISSDMAKLAESISAAYEERKKDAESRLRALEDLRNEVRDKLGAFEKQREKMSGELQKDRKDLLGRLHVADKDLRSSVKNLMKALGADRREKSAEQSKMLREFHGTLNDSVDTLLQAFTAERQDMSAEQSKMLQEFHGALNDSVKELLQVFTAERQDMKKTQDENLASMMKSLGDSAQDFKRDVQQMMRGVRQEHQENAKKVRGQLDHLIEELRQGSEALGNVQRGGSGKEVSRAAKAKKRKVEPEKKAPVVVEHDEASVIAAESLVQTVEEKTVTASEDLEGQVLEYISSRPKGVRVGDMEEPLGTNRMRLGVIAKKLYESNKVRKEENLYLPL